MFGIDGSDRCDVMRCDAMILNPASGIFLPFGEAVCARVLRRITSGNFLFVSLFRLSYKLPCTRNGG